MDPAVFLIANSDPDPAAFNAGPVLLSDHLSLRVSYQSQQFHV